MADRQGVGSKRFLNGLIGAFLSIGSRIFASPVDKVALTLYFLGRAR
jgi:hypothetical protein